MSDAQERNQPESMRETNGDKSKELMLVGLGASAGGLNALRQFFERMPTDSGLAFVVILHLSPEHESLLADLLQSKTSMTVTQVTETVKVEPNHVYVIPPEKNLVMVDGRIRLKEREQESVRQVPVDLFFRTLAESYKDRAFAIVLSGAGTDGSLGVRNIKAEGGIAIAQDPLEAEYDGMPRSAIESGAVDFILPVAAIPEKLVALRQNAERIQLPAPEKPRRNGNEEALREILTLLRARTRHDFTNYKRGTLLRRIERRLQVTESEDIPTYLEYVRNHPAELQGLLRDMLISVTNFFRDPEAFSALANEVVPRLFANKEAGNQVRVWTTGCATGEEAYSLAILLSEHAERLNNPPGIQVFATDIDDQAIATARGGVFPDTIAADVSPERLKRFFVREAQYYRVKREVREMVLFAPHNILRDPPFSKLDLISCRNLLIYLNRQMQERVLEIFHFGLRADGYLFLGASESADNLPALFSPVDKKHRIYLRRAVNTAFQAAPVMPVAGKWEAQLPVPPQLTTPPETFSFGELHYRMLEAFAPPSVLVDNAHDIVHLSEHAGRYLRFAGGEPSRSLLKAVHPDLQLELRSLLLAATHGSGETQSRNVLVNFAGEARIVNVSVRPIEAPRTTPGFLLVVFDEAPEPTLSPAGETTVEAPAFPAQGHLEAVVRQLEDELQHTKDQLRASIEQYETSTEELKASNEELQAMNEELRSATEEMETSKEELQSVNEELTTVNNELKERIEELSRANSDLQNLMASTEIGTLFLDRALLIRRYTPRMQELFNIIPTDVGRPLRHVTHKLDYAHLSEDAEEVLATLKKIEREVSTPDGQWFIARLLPYRTVEDKISGVVITFVDISERKRFEQSLRESEERLRLLVENALDYAIMILDSDGRYIIWNKGAERMFGYSESEALGQPAAIIFTPEDRERGVPQEEMATAEREGRAMDDRWHVRKDGSRFYVSGVMMPLRAGTVRGYAKIARDLTAQKQSQDALQKAWEELEQRVQERTGELAEANRALQEEVNERRRIERERVQLLRRIVSTQEDERRRISRELHDHLGQRLTALRLKLEGLKEQCGEQAELCGQIEQLQEIAVNLDAEVDFLAWELRPSVLDDLGLTVALANFVQEWSKHFGVPTEFHTTGLAQERLSQEVETNLYRIAQEALNNIAKHAAATSVDVLLERRDNHAVLIIEDNGRGFDPDQVTISLSGRGMGLIGMRERAALVGGTVEIESQPGEGTTVFVRTPVVFVPSLKAEEGEPTDD